MVPTDEAHRVGQYFAQSSNVFLPSKHAAQAFSSYGAGHFGAWRAPKPKPIKNATAIAASSSRNFPGSGDIARLRPHARSRLPSNARIDSF